MVTSSHGHITLDSGVLAATRVANAPLPNGAQLLPAPFPVRPETVEAAQAADRRLSAKVTSAFQSRAAVTSGRIHRPGRIDQKRDEGLRSIVVRLVILDMASGDRGCRTERELEGNNNGDNKPCQHPSGAEFPPDHPGTTSLV
jgi:hypothetical protein